MKRGSELRRYRKVWRPYSGQSRYSVERVSMSVRGSGKGRGDTMDTSLLRGEQDSSSDEGIWRR